MPYKMFSESFNQSDHLLHNDTKPEYSIAKRDKARGIVETEMNENHGGQSISDLKPGDKFEFNVYTFTLVQH